MGKQIVKIESNSNPRIHDDQEQNGIGSISDNGTNYERTYEPGTGFQRYANSLKNLIPFRSKSKEQRTMSIDSAGLLSIISFSWISKIMYKAHKKGITMEELPELSPYDAGTYNMKRLEMLWSDEVARRGPEKASFSRVAWRFCRTRVIASCIVFTGSLIFGFLSYTYFMRKLLEFVQSSTETYGEGIKWALLLITSEMSRTIFYSWTWSLNYRTALRLRSACFTLLYSKIMRVDNSGSKNIGKVINMFTNDAQKIFDVIVLGPTIIGAPISMVFGIFYILWLFGPVALVGMIVVLLYFPIQYIISRLTGYYQNKAVKISDLRVRLMNEILDCIKLIKMYAWEKRFIEDLQDKRKLEQRSLLRTLYWRTCAESLAPATPVVSAIVTFVTCLSFGMNLTAAQVFPYTAFLDSGLCLSLYLFQDGIFDIISAGISFNRMKSILLLQEGNCSVSKPIIKSQAVAITNGSFGYNTFGDEKGKNSQPNDEKRNNTSIIAEEGEQIKFNELTDNTEQDDVLFDISFEAAKGKLVGICGQVGSGKSSLLLAALGQLRISEGQVASEGSCAYVSQQAWITNATLKENILFGEKYDHSRYHEAICACNLIQDISMMPGGDRTEIGEKGVNLSGGQKQRVALARALYADRDIYFLDDPLSAVDSRVGSYIFDNLILRALKGKTVLFVTHQIQYLNRCDNIYLMRDGRIIEHGTHDELMQLGNEYAFMVAAISADNETEDKTKLDSEIEALPKLMNDIPFREANRSRSGSVVSHFSAKSVGNPNNLDTQLTVAEDVQQGTIKAQTYHSYIIAAGGYFFMILVVVMFVLFNTSIAFSSWWLAFWIKAGNGNTTFVKNNGTIPFSGNMLDNPDFSYYETIYISTIGIIILTSAIRSFVYTKAMIGASTRMHNNLFKKMIICPMRFFDTTPIGRLQHLFSRDMDEVDSRLPMPLASLTDCVIAMSLNILVLCTVFPWFILPLCILAAFFYFTSRIFRVAIRDLKRLDNKARGLMISCVTASAQGLSTIHAFRKENDFMEKFTKMFDDNSNCLFLYNGAMRWLGIRIDFLSVMVTGIIAILLIVLKDQVSPALSGLALAYAVQFSDMFQYTLRILSETEVRFISVERINHYTRTLEAEDRAIKPTRQVPPNWPSAAKIKFKNVNMAYGEGTPLALKNISFAVEADEKIGIVGRTGSGKSSLTVALFRLVELAGGKIEIDDVDISEVSLSQLRAKLSIIPQDPVLFSGTIRSNLDPFKLYTDAQIWEALEKTELKSSVQSINGQLDASVGFGGDNWSVGERQLLCLARALLRNSKILVLDEATAAVDPETEIAVQKTIQQAFSQCTILTIAHRLQTVLSLDRILVMDDGRVLEFDTSSNLLADPSSEFSKMMAAAEQAESK